MSAPDPNSLPAGIVGSSSALFERPPSQNSPVTNSRPLPQSPPLPLGIQQQHQRSVKRPRPVKSCTECRKRKLRCDRLCPCSQCQKSNRLCKYAADYDSANLSEGSDGEVESARPLKKSFGASSGPTAALGGEPTQYSNRRSAERPSSLGMGFVEELAVRMDRLEKQVLTRHGVDPRYGGTSLIPNPAPAFRGLSVKRGGQRTRLFGQNSTRVLVNIFDDAKDFLTNTQHTPDIDDTLLHFRKLHHALRQEYQDSLTPMTVFVDSVMPIWKRMMDILPQKPVCDRLVAQYMDVSEAICRILHFPTFREQYNLFWEGKLHSEYFLPQLLAVLAIVSRFTTKSQGFSHERIEGVHTPTAFALVRTWLDSLKGKQLTDIAVLQVELLLMVCRRALMFRPQELWIQLGSIVRMAMAMGLHRDPSELGSRISPFMGEIRRRLWFAVFELDVQNSFDNDMPCAIREGDYTCEAPRNLHDEDLHPDMKELPLGKPVEEHTRMQAQVLGAFSLPTRSRVSHLICRIDNLRDYQEVLELGGKLEDLLEDTNQITPRYGIADHSRMSRVWRERVSSDSHVRRVLLALYRPFVLNAPTCPPHIIKSFLRSCMIVLGYSEEPDPSLPHHLEVMGILHQVFKNDILPAAFSACYFIQTALPPHSNGILYEGQRSLRQVSETPSDTPPTANRFMWSPERLVQAVERAIGYLIQSIVRNTGTKDIVSLVVTLEMVRTPEPTTENMSRILRSTLDACLKAANSSRGKLAMVKLSSPQPGPASFGADTFTGAQAGAYAYGDPSMSHRNAHRPQEDSWTLWSGWD